MGSVDYRSRGRDRGEYGIISLIECLLFQFDLLLHFLDSGQLNNTLFHFFHTLINSWFLKHCRTSVQHIVRWQSHSNFINLWNTKTPNHPVLNAYLLSSLNSLHSLFLLSIRWFSNGEYDDSIHNVEHVDDRRQRRLLSLIITFIYSFLRNWEADSLLNKTNSQTI